MNVQVTVETESAWYYGKVHDVHSIEVVQEAMNEILADSNVQTDMFTLELFDGSYTAVPLIRVLHITAREVTE
jgi:hypothetical protein